MDKIKKDEGENDLALHHVLAAGNLERAAQLVEKNALDLLVHSRLTRLKKAVSLGSRPEADDREDAIGVDAINVPMPGDGVGNIKIHPTRRMID